ncbi:EF-P lysine aminoacylase EpmA [Faucicola boevrei]|uniref:EF-P lysine aminoacylase EpmA n=1 Tax=Faucicola boevrei TaxID=346665 RepID=UPI0003722913|nr:EF-P lysine aminoacylase EpmA [Moraxella boevrei]
MNQNNADFVNRSAKYQPNCTLEMARQRANVYHTIRQFFAERDVLEVQTPLLSKAGNTDIFLQSVSSNLTVFDRPTTYYLHTSPEFAMKRLLATWQVPIYQICSVFRDNEIGTRHNIEFTMLEWYRPHFSLDALAKELNALVSVVLGYPVVFDHYRYVDAFLDYVKIHPLNASCDTLKAIANDNGIFVDMGDDHQGWLDILFSHLVEPHLGKTLPTLIFDYPVATSALAKTAKDQDGNLVAKRFELYINGLEIANAYDELADSKLLRQRFEQDNTERQQRGLPVMPIDENLLQACDALPPCSGIAVGLDRLLMIKTNANNIEQVLSFTSPNA